MRARPRVEPFDPQPIIIRLVDSPARRQKRTPYAELQVDRRIFTDRIPAGCDLSRCRGRCCCEGVYVDLGERDRVLAHARELEPLMAGKRNRGSRRWFWGKWRDADAPSGWVCATRVERGRCVFQLEDGRCAPQVYAISRGMHPWALKSLNCIMYPLVVKDGVLTIEDVYQGRNLCGTVHGAAVPYVRSCREELEFLLGKQGYAQLVLMATIPSAVQGTGSRQPAGGQTGHRPKRLGITR